MLLSCTLYIHIRLSATPWTVSRQAPLNMGFPRQEYWNRLPFLPPGHLPDPGMEPESPALAGGFFTPEPPRCTRKYAILGGGTILAEVSQGQV